ncbi:MAG: CerR family C-terminal domain-containing protein [Rhodocyclaceae bacterium]
MSNVRQVAAEAPRTRTAASAPGGAAEQTRRRLVDAGLVLFGRYGFDGVTTRMLAAEAGVNQAAIPYHFGGKQGVYLAVARALCDTSAPLLRAAIESAQQRLVRCGAPSRAPDGVPQGAPDAPEDAELAGVLADFVGDVAAALLGHPDISASYAFFIREQLGESAAFEIIERECLAPVHDLLCELTGRVVGEPPQSETVILLAHALLGQIASFAGSRPMLLRRLGRKAGYSAGDLAAIVATVRRLALAMVLGWRRS